MKKKVANRTSSVTGNWDTHLACRIGADNDHGVAIRVLDGAHVAGMNEPLAMDT